MSRLRSFLAFSFARGATLVSETTPPESAAERVVAPAGQLEVAAARAALEAQVAAIGITPAWSKAPELRKQDDGSLAKVYWDPTDGVNGAAELIYRGEQLVTIGVHLAN